MQPHEERVVTEKQELDTKIEKLISFIETSKFNELNDENKELLKFQLESMENYSRVLGMRIALFPV